MKIQKKGPLRFPHKAEQEGRHRGLEILMVYVIPQREAAGLGGR